MRSAVLVLVCFVGCKSSDPSSSSPSATRGDPQPAVAKPPADPNDPWGSNAKPAPPIDVAASQPVVAAAPDLAKTRIVEKLRTIVPSNYADNVSADGLLLTFNGPLEVCDGRHLMKYWSQLKAAGADPAKLFDTFGCGEFGDLIDLHTKDHCRPDQTDSVILTDSGDARDRWLEKVANIFFHDGAPYLDANGCDATVVSTVSTADRTCDGALLLKLKAKYGLQLVPQGFLRLWCQPDGPYLDLK